MENIKDMLGKRVVLTSKNEVSYAGVVHSIIEVDGVEGVLLRIDKDSGFSVWCPGKFIKDVLVIPIPEEMREQEIA